MKNFAKAGEVLAEIWSKTVIDNYPTVAEYINPSDEVFITAKDQEWMAKHVRESQYLLQIVKCSNTSCCGTRRSSLFLFLPDGFLPPPLPVTQDRDGIKYGEAEETSKFLPLFANLAISKSILPSRAIAKYPKGVPYDFACPKLQNELPKRICPKCGCYFATIKSKTHHISDCHRNQQVCLEMKYNKTPAKAFTPPADEKKMGAIWIFVYYAVYGSGRGRCRDFLVLKWGGGS